MKALKFFSKLCIFSFVSFIICYIGINIYAMIIPNLNITNNGTYYLFDNKDTLVYQGSSTSSWVDLKDIDEDLINAVIAIEDKKFYNHFGFDILRIGKAMITNIQTGHIVQGASTITQQLVKNLYLEFDKTWERKIKEAFLTIITELQYNKEEILEAYLNTINYGNGNYGVSNASKYYFNKDVSNLSLEEAIILAGIPKSPNKYNPVSNKEESLKRASIVAKALLNNEFINNDTYNNLNFNNIEIYGKNDKNNLQMLMYYQDAVYKELESLGISKETLETGGLKVYTNLDIEKQSALEKNILNTITQDKELQVASVIVDPETGKIEALTGGIDYGTSQYNRATESKRQVGSTMKPFLYYAALENNLTASSKFKSEYTIFNINNKESYSPTNYNDKYANKDITMAAAIAFSDNIYAVKTNLFLGVDRLVDTAKTVGIKENLSAVPSLALGTGEINILDYATGYTTLASGGYKKDLYFIRKIEDKDGNVIYTKENKKSLVLNPNYVYILNELLANTSSSAFKDYTSATASTIASKLSRKYSIKTGTTASDYWTVGYNKDDLMLIWIGYDNNREFTKSYGYMTKNIWADTMEEIQSDISNNWYETPDNVVGVILDSVTGEVTNNEERAVVYYYLKGSEPLISSASTIDNEKKKN
ncbi:MAG: transglycosylase domain-containing protein [Bacilli bacterium]|nr:transglycosylase domain-containing protein [Bacilli bacterium]